MTLKIVFKKSRRNKGILTHLKVLYEFLYLCEVHEGDETI